ncbi:MAG TPA: anti-sigma factor [Gaiellales bacterium]|nr:anti-sigma factor [Gaiellales bacterium]
MNDERRINEIEDMLREAGTPDAPPAHFHAAARSAALGEHEVVELRTRRRMRARGGRFALAAAVLVASTAAALVIGVGGSRMQVDRSVHLTAAGPVQSASAVMDIGAASDNVRDVVVHIQGLKPAPAGGYYELWMQNGGDEPTGIVAFDTGSNGHVDARTTLPAGMTWTRCWVTLERADGSRTTVLTST